MSKIYVIDAAGLVSIAIIYHDKLTENKLYKVLMEYRSFSDKYITTDASIMAAFSMVSDLNTPTLSNVLMRVVRYFFDMAVPNFELAPNSTAKIYQDYGTFVQGDGSKNPPYVLYTGFVASILYPGAEVIGHNTPYYDAKGVQVMEP